MSNRPLRIASSASRVGSTGAAPDRGKARSLALACGLVASALLGGCASYGYGGYGGYGYGGGGSGYYGGTPYGYGGSVYDYGYGGYGYPYSYYGGYGGYYGYPYGYGYPYRPRPPQNHTPRPDPTTGNGVIGTPPPWRDPARRNARLNGQPIPSAGERPVPYAPGMGGRGRIQPSIQAPQDMRRSGRDVMRAAPSMERSMPRMERSAPRMERDAPRMRGGDAFGGRRERDGGLDQTP